MSFIRGWDPNNSAIRAVQTDDQGRLVVVADVAVSSSGSTIQDGANATIAATVRDYTNSNPLAVELVDTDGNPVSGTGGGPATVADGADVAEGATTDVAVTGDNTGTISAKLRGLAKLWASVWDSVNGWLKVSIQNATLAVTQSGTWTVQPGNTANTTAWKVDGSAVTQPVSDGGASLTVDGTVAASNLPATVDTNSGNKSASTLRVVLATDQPALTNKLLVTPDANSAVNVAQIAGTAASVNVGAVDAGTQRVVQANDAGRTLVSKSGSASSSGNNTLVAAGTNKLKVFAFSLTTTSTTAVTVKFQDGAGGTDLWSVVLQAPTSVSTGANLAVTPPAHLFKTSAATLLNLNLSAAVAVQWSVAYYDEA